MAAMLGWLRLARDLRFPLEPGEAIWIRREGVGQDLQGDLAAQLRVGGLPDLAHAALAEKGGHVVVVEAGAGSEWHDLVEANGSFYAEAVHGSSGCTECLEKAHERLLAGPDSVQRLTRTSQRPPNCVGSSRAVSAVTEETR